MNTWTYLGSVSDRNIARILANPTLVWDVITANDLAPSPKEEGGLKGMLGRLLGKKPPEFVPDPNYSPEERRLNDVAGAWLVLTYLLTGDPQGGESSLNFLVTGGTQVGDLDVGDGPARAFTSDQVRVIAAELNLVRDADAEARYEAAVALDPDIMDEPDFDEDEFDEDDEEFLDAPDTTRRHVFGCLEVLRTYIANTVALNQGLIVWRADPPEDRDDWWANVDD